MHKSTLKVKKSSQSFYICEAVQTLKQSNIRERQKSPHGVKFLPDLKCGNGLILSREMDVSTRAFMPA